MKINLVKFGDMLVSHPAGREAYLSAKAYLLKGDISAVEIVFDGVKVLTPSWLSEFLDLFKTDFPKAKISFCKSKNPSVQATLKILKF